MPSGVVAWFDPDRGRGAIRQTGAGDEIAAERSAVQGDGCRALRAGEQVRFDITRDGHGVRADNVRRIPRR
ncbi:cold shock domain-containing protein [Streptomyces sp. ET3-23]|uniref:cold-shock protein n=1 Tax=Streptomyces sp. ET3-23 TaxID=2885643 RepID=UPI001D126D9D|nr:cold shock domain-containing protein [Streptomyces sp. ET3-23]